MRSFLFLASTLALAACSADATDVAPNDSPNESGEFSEAAHSNAVVVSNADNGKTVSIVEGGEVILKLKSNPTTGYDWQIVTTDRTFGYGQTRYVRDPVPGDLMGAGGTRIFTWQTAAPIPGMSMVGKHTVTLAYSRSGDPSALRSFEFTVDVIARR